jgi:glycosyltransferase involved in cell wall biosynthesis
MDMRDLWSLAPRLPEGVASPWWRVLARRYERRTVRDAALIVINTEPARIAMEALYPMASDRTIAIWNGSDEEPLVASHHGSSFIIAYAGSIYLDRDPRPLFRGAARVIREYQLTPDQLRLEFMGEIAAYGGATLEAIAEAEGIGGFVRTYPAGTRAEAMQFMARAAMLVSLPLDRGTDVAFPAKIFEYTRFDAWLVALAERGGATDLVLDGTGADVIAPDDVDAIAGVVRTRYLAYVQGARPTRPHLSDRFSRRFQANLLFDEIERRLPRR